MSMPEFSVGDLVAGWLPYEMNGIIIKVDTYTNLHDINMYEESVTCYFVYWPNSNSSWYLHDELILIQENPPAEE